MRIKALKVVEPHTKKLIEKQVNKKKLFFLKFFLWVISVDMFQQNDQSIYYITSVVLSLQWRAEDFLTNTAL